VSVTHLFSKLRIYRKQLAENDTVPAYAVFTDAELAEIAKLESITHKNLLTINGIDEKRVEKYGKQICEMCPACAKPLLSAGFFLLQRRYFI
jgi:ATP-dependent DNA helicase RecQ